jgi:hypothetical protein
MFFVGGRLRAKNCRVIKSLSRASALPQMTSLVFVINY